MPSPSPAQTIEDVVRLNVRRLREEAGMTQSQLAARMTELGDSKVHAPYISDIEQGVKRPGLPTLGRLAESLGVEPSCLLSADP